MNWNFSLNIVELFHCAVACCYLLFVSFFLWLLHLSSEREASGTNFLRFCIFNIDSSVVVTASPLLILLQIVSTPFNGFTNKSTKIKPITDDIYDVATATAATAAAAASIGSAQRWWGYGIVKRVLSLISGFDADNNNNKNMCTWLPPTPIDAFRFDFDESIDREHERRIYVRLNPLARVPHTETKNRRFLHFNDSTHSRFASKLRKYGHQVKCVCVSCWVRAARCNRWRRLFAANSSTFIYCAHCVRTLLPPTSRTHTAHTIQFLNNDYVIRIEMDAYSLSLPPSLTPPLLLSLSLTQSFTPFPIHSIWFSASAGRTTSTRLDVVAEVAAASWGQQINNYLLELSSGIGFDARRKNNLSSH